MQVRQLFFQEKQKEIKRAARIKQILQTLQKTYCAQRNKIRYTIKQPKIGCFVYIIRKYMSFFTTFYRSLFDLNWLKENKNKAKKAWGYFFVFMLAITLFQIGPTLIGMPKAVREFRDDVEQKVPDFVAHVKDGELSIEKLVQPFVYEAKGDGKDTFKILVDANTTTTFSTEEVFRGFETGILITKTKVIVKESADKESSMNFSNMPNKDFSKTGIIGLMDKFKGIVVFVFSILFIAFIYLVMSISKLIFLLIISLLTMVVCSIAKKAYKFNEIYTIGLFAITLPTLIKTIEFWLGFSVPLVYTMVLLVLILGVVFSKDKEETPQIQSPQENK